MFCTCIRSTVAVVSTAKSCRKELPTSLWLSLIRAATRARAVTAAISISTYLTIDNSTSPSEQPRPLTQEQRYDVNRAPPKRSQWHHHHQPACRCKNASSPWCRPCNSVGSPATSPFCSALSATQCPTSPSTTILDGLVTPTAPPLSLLPSPMVSSSLRASAHVLALASPKTARSQSSGTRMCNICVSGCHQTLP